MRVYVRVRALNEREESSGSKKTIDVIDNQLLVFDPIELDVNQTTDDQSVYHRKRCRETGRRPNKNLKFVFDRVFDDNFENIQIYELSTKSFVESLLNGYNCAVFAYGATGSGRTYTMLGANDDPGIIVFTTKDLFRQLEAKSEEEKLELSISYFEIYNEIVFDLLDRKSRKALAVREDSRRGVVVNNLSVHQPKDANHLIEILKYGNRNRNRTQHPTDSNAESSRSHAVFQISLKKQHFSSAQEMSIQVSKMSLIDLAGSERASNAYKTNRSKSFQREVGNINKSLLALGNCITALASSDLKRKRTYIPYRDSKLTFLLRDSLGGNCQTSMIATVSASSIHYAKTYNTLVYAERAKGIERNVRKKTFSVGLQPRNYNHLMEAQNRKIIDLSEQLAQLTQENERLRSGIDTIFHNEIMAKSDSNTSTLCLDLKDANTSTEHNCPAIEVTDKGVGNSFVGLVDTHTSTETPEMCDRNTSASIEFDNKSTSIEAIDGLNCFSDKETITECSDTAMRTDKSIATQVSTRPMVGRTAMTSSSSSPLNSSEDLVSKDQMKKLIEKYENIIKEKEEVIQFHRKSGVDRDQKLKYLEEEKNKLNDKINLNVELNLEQLLKRCECLKPSSTASSVVYSTKKKSNKRKPNKA